MRTLILTLIAALFCVTALAKDEIHGDLDAARAAWPLIDEGALVIDVRSPEEFAEGHLPGAVNAPYDDLDALLAALGDDHDRQVVLYCRSGRRVGVAIEELEKKGFTRLYNATGLEALEATRKTP